MLQRKSPPVFARALLGVLFLDSSLPILSKITGSALGPPPHCEFPLRFAEELWGAGDGRTAVLVTITTPQEEEEDRLQQGHDQEETLVADGLRELGPEKTPGRVTDRDEDPRVDASAAVIQSTSYASGEASERRVIPAVRFSKKTAYSANHYQVFSHTQEGGPSGVWRALPAYFIGRLYR